MAILNYTTTISTDRTMGEIQRLLAKNGAREVSIRYDDAGEPTAIRFVLVRDARPLHFQLPNRWQGVYAALQSDKKVQPRYRTVEQALRVSWRIIKDWLEAQLALIEAELASPTEVFLPYAITDDGRTLAERYEDVKLLDCHE
jgi:hypothetical protein